MKVYLDHSNITQNMHGASINYRYVLDVSRTRPHVRITGNPNLRQTVETRSRARPAPELDVDSPGATRICSLLVRGTLTFRSFRRLPNQVETGRTCDVYNGQLVHPCRVQSFRKAVSTVMDVLRPRSCS